MPRFPSLSAAILLTAAVPGSAPAPAMAQRAPSDARIELGIQGDFAPDVADGSFGVGLRAARPLGHSLPGLALMVAGDVFFPDCDPAECGFWELSGDVTYAFTFEGRGLHPYFGGGLTYQRLTTDEGTDLDVSEGDFGFNVLAGVKLEGAFAGDPFLEARYDLMTDFENQWVLALGLLF